MPEAEAFRLDRMKTQGFTDYTHGMLVTDYHVNLSSSELANNSFSSVSTEAKVGFCGIGASIGASMDTQQAQANGSFNENIVLQSIDSGGFMNFRGLDGWMTDEIYSCAFGAFKHYYDAVLKASNQREYVVAYGQFSKHYGDSCVTKVHLVAGSALQITLKKEGGAQSNNHKYGASTSVSTPFGGVSAATDWGKGMSGKHSGGNMDVHMVHYPDNTPTRKLIEDEFTKRIDQSFAKLATQPFTDQSVAAPPTVTPPEIKDYEGKEEKKEAPDKELSDGEIKEADDEKEKNLAKKAGHEGTLEQYQKDKQQKFNDLKNNTTKKKGASHVVKEARRATRKKKYGDSLHSNNNNMTLSTIPTDSDNKMVTSVNDGNMWDLGGFLVNSYETTKWTTLFPLLERTFPLDDSFIYVIRLWLYLLTRYELLQYLHFLLDVGDVLDYYWVKLPGGKKSNLENLKNDATLFSKLCVDLKKEIVRALNKPDFSQEHYLDQIVAFDDKLRIENRFTFASMKIYDTFFEHYDVFHNNPLGFVRTRITDAGRLAMDTDRLLYLYHSQEKGDYIMNDEIDGRRLPALLTRAVRSYPVINVDGNARMVFYSGYKYGDKGFTLTDELDFFGDYHKDPNGGTLGWECYTNPILVNQTYNFTYYGVNYDDLDINGGKLFGVPFLNRLPFDEIVLPLHPDDA